jgi:ribonuclease HI
MKWLPPPVDVLKINSDGVFIANEKCGAWGFVISDSAGQGVLARSGRLPAVHDALAAEGEACLAALYAAMAAGISRIIIETDSSNLALALRSDSFDQSQGVLSTVRLVIC